MTARTVSPPITAKESDRIYNAAMFITGVGISGASILTYYGVQSGEPLCWALAVLCGLSSILLIVLCATYRICAAIGETT